MTRILLAGFGGMGHVHYENAKRIVDAEIIGIVGTEKDAQSASDAGLPFFLSIKNGIRALSPDIVDITTPTFLHKANAIEALEEGRDVIIEKPLALSSEDGCEIYECAERNNRDVYPALVMRYTKEFGILSSLIQNGKYGAVVRADFNRISPLPMWSKDSWLFDRRKSGLIPFDLHIHDLDMIYALFGEPESIEPYSPIDKEFSFPLYYSIEYRYKSFSVHAEAGWLRTSMPFQSGWRVIFEDAVVLNADGKIMLYENNADPLDLTPLYDTVISTGINVPPTGWYYEELKHIIAEHDGREKKRIKKEEVIGTLRIAEKL